MRDCPPFCCPHAWLTSPSPSQAHDTISRLILYARVLRSGHLSPLGCIILYYFPIILSFLGFTFGWFCISLSHISLEHLISPQFLVFLLDFFNTPYISHHLLLKVSPFISHSVFYSFTSWLFSSLPHTHTGSPSGPRHELHGVRKDLLRRRCP